MCIFVLKYFVSPKNVHDSKSRIQSIQYLEATNSSADDAAFLSLGKKENVTKESEPSGEIYSTPNPEIHDIEI